MVGELLRECRKAYSADITLILAATGCGVLKQCKTHTIKRKNPSVKMTVRLLYETNTL